MTFWMNFSATPALVVTYLRSYERFGAAVVSIGDTAQEVVTLVDAQRARA